MCIRLFIVSKKWKQPIYVPVDEWMNKMWYICTIEYYSAVRKNDLLIHVAGTNLESVMLSQRNQSQPPHVV